jgi:hypothetical protein
MFSRVYYWGAANGNIGHSSMDIAFGEGPGLAEYVSWYPKSLEGDILGGTGETKDNYVDDKKEESSEAWAVVDLTCLDIWAMKASWRQWKQANHYAVYSDNCAKAVAQLLWVGGGIYDGFCNQFYDGVIVWSPYQVWLFAQMIATSTSEIEQKRGVIEV